MVMENPVIYCTDQACKKKLTVKDVAVGICPACGTTVKAAAPTEEEHTAKKVRGPKK